MSALPVLNATPYDKYIVHASLQEYHPLEDIGYAVICEFLMEHKVPKDRYVIYSQLALPWKPENQDRRREVTDFGVGNLTLNGPPYFKLRVGAEVKRALPVMTNLPMPSAIEDEMEVKSAFHELYFQGEDQAKAASKGGFNFPNRPQIPFFLFVGPYWTSVSYGPFSEAELSVRTHKPSPSADWKATQLAKLRLKSNPSRRTLYLLGTTDSAIAMGHVISATDGHAAPLRAAANNFHGKLFLQLPLLYNLSGVQDKLLKTGQRSRPFALTKLFSTLASFSHFQLL